MRTAVTVSAAFFMLTFVPLVQCQDPPSDTLFSPDQLDNLLAPVALYPDPLLAQVLVAATFPDQIDEAARFVRADSNPNDIDGQSWDVSVKAVAHYPTVLNMMADQLDWTTSLGQAYVDQQDDLMASVQRLRAEAQAAGNLQSNADMQVVDDNGSIEIWPAQPQYIFVPEYDPSVIYFGPGGFNYGSGFYIGAWLNCDFDWGARRLVYHGWNENRGWITRSKPFIRPTGTYVNDRLRYVAGNRTVVNRTVNFGNLDRFDSVHRGVGYDRIRPTSPAPDNRSFNNGGYNAPATNKIIQQNFNANDSRINDYRGHVQEPQQPQPQPRPEVTRPQAPPRSVESPRVQPREERPAPSAFGGNQGGFNARESSQRGQASRQEAQRPAPESRPAPAPRAEPPARSAPEPRPAPAAREEGGRKR